MKLKKNLYLLHEVSNREIETKLFYRLWQINLDIGVTFQRNFFLENIKKFYPGIKFKSLTGSDLSTIRIIKNSNHKLYVLTRKDLTMGRRVQI